MAGLRLEYRPPGSVVHVLVTVLCHTALPVVCPEPEGANTAGGLRDGLAVTGLLPALIQVHSNDSPVMECVLLKLQIFNIHSL